MTGAGSMHLRSSLLGEFTSGDIGTAKRSLSLGVSRSTTSAPWSSHRVYATLGMMRGMRS